MAHVQKEAELGAGVDEVWKLVSDFGGLIESMGVPVEVEGAGIGQIRTITMGSSQTVERLEELDEGARRLVYSIVSGPVPVVNYRSTMEMTAVGDGRTKLTWSSTFDPTPGTAEADAETFVDRVYTGGIAALQARFGA